MPNPQHLANFAAIIQTGSISAAAAKLGCGKSVVSRQLARVENVPKLDFIHSSGITKQFGTALQQGSRDFYDVGFGSEIEQYWWHHNGRRTQAMASEKVGCGLAYPALVRPQVAAASTKRCAARDTNEYKPIKRGVVRAMAWSDHCRWVSTPRCKRASSNWTSSCQRSTNESRIWVGATS